MSDHTCSILAGSSPSATALSTACLTVCCSACSILCGSFPSATVVLPCAGLCPVLSCSFLCGLFPSRTDVYKSSVCRLRTLQYPLRIVPLCYITIARACSAVMMALQYPLRIVPLCYDAPIPPATPPQYPLAVSSADRSPLLR